jgi:DNA-directed RNA polymerase beta' subunit
LAASRRKIEELVDIEDILTHRLVDVAQDIVVLEENCGTENGLLITPIAVFSCVAYAAGE